MGKILYSSSVFDVEEYNVRFKKAHERYIRVREPSSAIILPVLSGERLILERQYRHAIKKWIYELPGGHINRGESPRKTAARELKEETGYIATSLKFMFKNYELPDLTTASRYFYVAKGLRSGKRNLDPSEKIDIRMFALKRALEMVDSGTINDPATVSALLYYSRNKKRLL
ncbi:NUDIX hydrolase [Candidatus Marsarchaeota archaeon]|jgi:ADP-ribose pyrophosphatase|nr:NUDIX hydrolase [Candidatus Marsarchaeota archaeon]